MPFYCDFLECSKIRIRKKVACPQHYYKKAKVLVLDYIVTELPTIYQ